MGVREGNGDREEAESEKDVDDAEAEERDVAEPDHAAAQRGVATHPFISVEKESDCRAGSGSGDHRDPSDHQVEPGGLYHDVDNAPTAPRNSRVLDLRLPDRRDAAADVDMV